MEDLCSFDKIFHTSCETGFGLEALKEYITERSLLRPWRYHPAQVSTMSEVGKAEEAMKQAIFEKFYQELPYQVGIKVAAWVPKINGELRVDYQIDVKSRVQQGMLLGEKARIIREVRERCQQLLA